ncbi:MAG TPA: hypothetical protein PKN61_11695 [Acidobacteriota bacterium]|nr:hypothetical protein [Acidobacteriota bacterium]HNU01903.1 hypothetical protein [Acidobacteriota bacterium]
MSKPRVMMVAWIAIIALMIPAMAADFAHRTMELKPALKGTGVWLYKGAPSTDPQNALVKSAAPRSAYRWTPRIVKNGGLSILVYADDAYHAAPNTFTDQALQWWSLGYTAFYDGNWSGFETALQSQPWDIVIVANDNYGPQNTLFDLLDAHVTGGGALYFHSWTTGDWTSAKAMAYPFFAHMGIDWNFNDYDPPDPVLWWDPAHQLFNFPMSVPEFTNLSGGRYGTYGQHLHALPGFDTVAGYTPAPSAGEAALVTGNDGRTIFRGFCDGQNDADLDTDGMPDGRELWINIVGYFLGLDYERYDLIFVDDYGRSKLCINSDTGDYVYHVLTGTGAGEYTGTGVFKPYNYGFYFYNQDGNPWLVYVNHATNINRATGYLKWGAKRINSVLYDRVTTNNPTTCD